MQERRESGAWPAFDRQRLPGAGEYAVLGDGEIGGKARGLVAIRDAIAAALPGGAMPHVHVGIPRFVALATDVFERFLDAAGLRGASWHGASNVSVAHAFLKGELPATIAGDLRALSEAASGPLAVRSSSLLEDALHHPFAGVYATKMISNVETSPAERFRRLADAIKLVWASTHFRDARGFRAAMGRGEDEERMAVVIQEVVGERYGDRFYPVVSGVARTHNCYPRPPARREDGVVSLALGLGKTIVDGGACWTYSPAYPNHDPPFASADDLVQRSQSRFWAIRMTPAPYDPASENEHMVECDLEAAEWDDVLRFTASTYDAASDRLVAGVSIDGARALTFAPLLRLDAAPLNELVRRAATACREALGGDVEIEFAMTLDRRRALPARFEIVQARPIRSGGGDVRVEPDELLGPNVLVASDAALGDGAWEDVADVVYVVPARFSASRTREIAAELDARNEILAAEGRRCVLIGFGRWGSSDPNLGIPVTWPQISRVRVLVECSTPAMHVDASQGSHFFHNLVGVGAAILSVRHTGSGRVDFDWLARSAALDEGRFVRHVRLGAPLRVRVDGSSGRGVVIRASDRVGAAR